MSEPLTTAPSGETDGLRLALHLCFSIQNASRAFGAVYRKVLKDLGLTYPQYLVMLALWEHGPLTVKRLGELLRLDSGTLSPLLKRVEAMGLVARERSAEDERSVIISLTEAGREMRGPAQQVPLRIQEAAGLREEDAQALDVLLRRLTTSLDAAV
jgi:DNA-binding MarR family transcriptional regulator